MQLDSDVSKKVSKPPFKQTCIAATILCLTFLSQANVEDKSFYDLYTGIVAAVLLVLLVILTEYKGRKLLFITLLVLITLSSMEFLPVDISLVGEAFQSAVRGATAVLTGVVLCEYSEPRHRMVYLIIHATVLRLSCCTYALYTDRHPELESYLMLFKVALGVICLGSAFTWPESPYWLASKGRFEEAKKAFLIVRGEDQKSTEIQELIETQQQRVTSKMILVPLLIGIPLIFALSTNNMTLELNFLLVISRLGAMSNNYWLYLVFNVFVSVVYMFASSKLSRKRLLFMSSSLAILFILLFVLYLYLSEPSSTTEIFITFFAYLLIIGAFTCVDYPISIEIIPCKYNNVISGILGLTYVAGELCYPLMSETFISLIMFCLLVNPIIAYFLLPELKDKTKIEIEQAYRPKQVQGPTDL